MQLASKYGATILIPLLPNVDNTLVEKEESHGIAGNYLNLAEVSSPEEFVLCPRGPHVQQ